MKSRFNTSGKCHDCGASGVWYGKLCKICQKRRDHAQGYYCDNCGRVTAAGVSLCTICQTTRGFR